MRRPPQRQARLPFPDLKSAEPPVEVPPPVPAPYLVGAPEFPDDLLALMEANRLSQREAKRIARYRRVCKRDIRRRREQHEQRTGQVIKSEPTPKF